MKAPIEALEVLRRKGLIEVSPMPNDEVKISVTPRLQIMYDEATEKFRTDQYARQQAFIITNSMFTSVEEKANKLIYLVACYCVAERFDVKSESYKEAAKALKIILIKTQHGLLNQVINGLLKKGSGIIIG